MLYEVITLNVGAFFRILTDFLSGNFLGLNLALWIQDYCGFNASNAISMDGNMFHVFQTDKDPLCYNSPRPRKAWNKRASNSSPGVGAGDMSNFPCRSIR